MFSLCSQDLVPLSETLTLQSGKHVALLQYVVMNLFNFSKSHFLIF